ncbi:helix-turn-helix transcriptional regulator [Hoeflea alexandrii]|uniref:helix-turn-helix transcriptional regulator n=1 Tax=Hoeflea alexandrii TaxID=288436 RepID=UPI00226F9D76|nr:helix-turn-helix domain-containing protein [Hoeflea alexandrii]MCY0151668.1 helix-turn-helix domain-containing protein [Hoeflea alexandrii]
MEPEKQNQRVDTETGSVETEISAQDDRAKQTAAVIVPCLMTVEDVATYLRMSVSKVWRSRRKDPDFPQPIRLGGSTRWERLEVDHYLEVYKARRRNGR